MIASILDLKCLWSLPSLTSYFLWGTSTGKWNGLRRRFNSLLALYPGGVPKRYPPSCEAPREPTMYVYTEQHKTKILKRLQQGLIHKNIVMKQKTGRKPLIGWLVHFKTSTASLHKVFIP